MIPAELPFNDTERVARLHALAVLDTQPDPILDELTRLAANLCQTPMALISLVDKERQWFKSTHGLASITETPRDLAFCAHAILSEQTLEVRDARQDPRFSENPLVTQAPYVTFYAGTPLVSKDGFHIGTLCVIDQIPKQLSTTQLQQLQHLGNLVIQVIEFQSTHHTIARQLLQSENRYRSLIEEHTDLIWMADLDLKITYANPALAKFLGKSVDEIVNQAVTDLVPAAARDNVIASMHQLQKSRGNQLFEQQIVAADSQVRWVKWSSRIITDEKGQPSALFSSGYDITKQKLAQDTANNLAAIVATSDAAIFSKDLQGYITSWNTAAEQQFGYKANEIIGQPASILAPRELHTEQKLLVDMVLGGEPIPYYETVRLHKNGKRIDVATTLSPVINAKDNVIGVSIISRDISERKVIERQLINSERRYRQLYESTPAMLHSIDTEGNIMHVSNAWLKNMGFGRTEVIGRASKTFLSDASRIYAEQVALPNFFENGYCDKIPYEFIRKDGSVIEVLLSGILLLDQHGEPHQSVAFLEDVTEKNQLVKRFAFEHNLLQCTLNSIDYGVIAADLDGNITYLNHHAENLLACDGLFVQGKPLNSVYITEDYHSHKLCDNAVPTLLENHTLHGVERYKKLHNSQHETCSIKEMVNPIINGQAECHGLVVLFHKTTA